MKFHISFSFLQAETFVSHHAPKIRKTWYLTIVTTGTSDLFTAAPVSAESGISQGPDHSPQPCTESIQPTSSQQKNTFCEFSCYQQSKVEDGMRRRRSGACMVAGRMLGQAQSIPFRSISEGADVVKGCLLWASIPRELLHTEPKRSN